MVVLSILFSSENTHFYHMASHICPLISSLPSSNRKHVMLSTHEQFFGMIFSFFAGGSSISGLCVLAKVHPGVVGWLNLAIL
jgi:hypothetical protein